jgi:hypothetical protein
MATVNVSTLVQDIISDIPEIPGFVAARQYLRAVRELCEAKVWRIDLLVTAIANTPTYDLTALFPTETVLVDLISMKPYDGSTPVKPKTQAWLDTNWADWRDDTALLAKYYVQEDANTMRLVPTPAELVVDAYTVRAAVKPTMDATFIDTLLANRYSELLISGAKAHLFLTPRKPWTDLTLGQYHRANFVAGIPEAESEAADEFQTGVARKVKYGGL